MTEGRVELLGGRIVLTEGAAKELEARADLFWARFVLLGGRIVLRGGRAKELWGGPPRRRPRPILRGKTPSPAPSRAWPAIRSTVSSTTRFMRPWHLPAFEDVDLERPLEQLHPRSVGEAKGAAIESPNETLPPLL